MTITLIILIITVAMFIWGKVRADIVALTALAALLVFGILTRNLLYRSLREQYRNGGPHDAYHHEPGSRFGHAVVALPHAARLRRKPGRNAYTHRYAAQPGYRRGAYRGWLSAARLLLLLPRWHHRHRHRHHRSHAAQQNLPQQETERKEEENQVARRLGG